MKEAYSIIWEASWLILAVAVFFGVMWAYVRAHSAMWRRVAPCYEGQPVGRRIAKKFPETIIVTARGASGPLITGNIAYRAYAGTIIAVHEEGLALSLILPFSLMCPPLFLRFEEMQLVQTSWALWRDPMAIRMKRLSGDDIILARDTVQWIRNHVDRSPFAVEV